MTIVKKLPSDLKTGELVLIHFEGGQKISWFYAGQLETRINGKFATSEQLFVERLSEIRDCRQTRKYHKISDGYCSLFSGLRVVGYQQINIKLQEPVYELVVSSDGSWANGYKNARVTPPKPDSALSSPKYTRPTGRPGDFITSPSIQQSLRNLRMQGGME